METWIYNKEMKKLAAMLAERCVSFNYKVFEVGCQILCQDWDVLCIDLSMGHEKGLLEYANNYEVMGYLTAEEVIKKVFGNN